MTAYPVKRWDDDSRTPIEHVVDAADMQQQRAIRALLDRKRPTVLGDALVQIAFEVTLLRAVVAELAKRERWYQAKLRDAYHVIGNPRR